MVMAMSESVMVVCIPLEVMLSNGVSIELADWFGAPGDVRKLSEEHLSITLLLEAESMIVPFGHVAFFTPVPSKGDFEKASKDKLLGQILVQWLLPKEQKAPSEAVATEVQHSVTKVFASMGQSKPWSVIQDPLKEWLDTAIKT